MFYDNWQSEQEPLITEQEKRALVPLAQAGDNEAMLQLLLADRRYIWKCARRWYPYGCRSHFDDCLQEATMGYMHGIRKFDLSRELTVLTYVTFWIRQRLGAMREHMTCIRVGRCQREDDEDFKRAKSVTSLNAEHGDGRTGWSLLQLITDGIPEPESEDRERFEAAMRRINPRRAAILKERFHGRGLADIGHEVGISGERVRQIEVKAIEDVKRLLNASGDDKPSREPEEWDEPRDFIDYEHRDLCELVTRK